MDRRPGFKECPKCGLRNKPSATQCDFCGQNLGPSDDWQQHIRDLESLNKMELRRSVDERTSKRIESTIIRKDAPVTRNVEIREAGNIGKALKELESPPTKDKGQEPKGDGARVPPVNDRLKIKEASTVYLVDRETEKPHLEVKGTTIADILKEPVKELEPLSPASELPAEERPSASSPSSITKNEASDEKIEETSLPEPEPVPIPESGGVALSQAKEPLPDEEPEATASTIPSSEPVEEIVPAKEVTLEVLQPAQEEVSPGPNVSEEEGSVAISTTDSHETIKLKLVEVERPKERLAPSRIEPHISLRRKAAIAVLALGSVAYLIILSLTVVGALGATAGIGGGAVSSIMIISGAAVIYPLLRGKRESEVYICPKCHEKVEETSEGCPACGAEFES